MVRLTERKNTSISGAGTAECRASLQECQHFNQRLQTKLLMMRWGWDCETVHCISGSFHLLNIANNNNRQECVEWRRGYPLNNAWCTGCLIHNGDCLQSVKIFSPVNSGMRKKRGVVKTEQIIQLWLMKSLNINNYLATNLHAGFGKIFLKPISRQSGLLWTGSIIILLTYLTFSEASPQLPFICKVRPGWSTTPAHAESLNFRWEKLTAPEDPGASAARTMWPR